MLCSWTTAFSPSFSRGPSFPDCFCFYFWGRRTGEQKWEILPWQVHTPKMVSAQPSRQKNCGGRGEATSSYYLSQMLVYMNATEKARLGDPGSAPSPPEPFLTRTWLKGPHPQGPREKRGQHEAPPLPLLTCSAAASPDMASGDDNGHTGRQREARKEK